MSKEQDLKHYTDFREIEREREEAKRNHKCGDCQWSEWLSNNTLVFCSRFPCVKDNDKGV
jgi:hypothetical protein